MLSQADMGSLKNSKIQEAFSYSCSSYSLDTEWLKSGFSVAKPVDQHAGHIQNVRDNWTVDKQLNLSLEIDGEWYQENNILQPISLQVAEFAAEGERWERFYEHPLWKGEKQYPTWLGETILEDLLGVSGHQFRPQNCEHGKPLVVDLAIFFSEGDIRLFLGDRLAKELFLSSELKRKSYLFSTKSIKVSYWLEREGVARIVLVNIRDYSGYSGSLLDTARELNIVMPSKTTMDAYKACMNLGYKRFSREFVNYAMGDLALYKIHQVRLDKQNFLRSTLGLPEREKIAMSSGREVNDLFLDFLKQQIQVSRAAVEQLSLLKKKENSRSADNYLELILEQGSVLTMLDADAELTTRYLGLIHGGRARNESGASVLSKGFVVSADIASAYSSAMSAMVYPIGLPTIVSFPVHEPSQWLTLKQMLDGYESEFVDNLWVAIVDTIEPLTFDQDVLFSKTNVKLTLKAVITQNEDQTESGDAITADFGLLTRELENSVLTSSTLELLKRVANRREWAELEKKVRIKALMFYPKSEECKDYTEWEAKVLTGGMLSTKNNKHHKGNEKQDDRSRAWVGVKLADFLEPLSRERSKLKKMRNQEQFGSDAYNEIDAQQDALKRAINTLYGVVCSRYFQSTMSCLLTI